MSKKLVSLAAVLMLLVTLMLPATAFTDYDYTKFGGKSATLNKQGRNLYLMSADGLTNADAVYDTAAFTELSKSADSEINNLLINTVCEGKSRKGR